MLAHIDWWIPINRKFNEHLWLKSFFVNSYLEKPPSISGIVYQKLTGPEGHQNLAPTEYRESRCPFIENYPNKFF